MSTTPLFLDNPQSKITFSKVAMSIQLSDNVDNWQREISSEIYKYLPYLGKYSVNVMIQRANPERGFAYGSAEVQNPSEVPLQEAKTGAKVVIPIIVTDRLLKPLDVFFSDGESFPLNQERLDEALFTGETFEPSTRKPVDKGMVDQMHPPIRTNYGYGAGVTTGAAAGGAGFGKFASLCGLVGGTLSPQEEDELVSKLAEDPQLSNAVETNPAFRAAAAQLIGAPKMSAEKTAAQLVARIKPTAVQFTKLADGNFRVRWGSLRAFLPQEKIATPVEAQEMAGTDDIQGLPPDQSMTVGTEEAAVPEETNAQEISEPGTYSVRAEEDGQERVGAVLPVVDFDGTDMPLLLFTDGEVYSLQDNMAGTMVGEDLGELPFGEPQGNGAFILDGATALPPVTIQNQVTDEEGNASFICQTPFGEEVTLSIVPGLATLEQGGECEYMLPESAQFTPLGEPVHVTKTEGDAEVVKEARLSPRRGWIRSTGPNEFHLDGWPFTKLASDHRQFLESDMAEFLLVTAGMTSDGAREKLAASRSGLRPIPVDGLHTITPLAHVHNESMLKAATVLKDFPGHLRKDTIKLAATLDDSETADNILALNFLNPENIAIFASYLPQLDETVKRLAEMLIASRMGLKTLDEGALERAMKNLEEVIMGLKAMQAKDLL